jgi:hypothetical protein
VLALLLAALLACELNPPSLQPRVSEVPTLAKPPTTAATAPATTTATAPATTTATATATTVATAPATVVPTKPTIEGLAAFESVQELDPCSLPAIQFLAGFFSIDDRNALTSKFTGDVTILKTKGGPNIFSIQEASVQRKFVILLPNLNPAIYDLTLTYMSYTEKTGANDKNPRIWKGVEGFLQVGMCPKGGTGLRTIDFLADGLPARFEPLPGGHNTATGYLLMDVEAKIQ